MDDLRDLVTNLSNWRESTDAFERIIANSSTCKHDEDLVRRMLSDSAAILDQVKLLLVSDEVSEELNVSELWDETFDTTSSATTSLASMSPLQISLCIEGTRYKTIMHAFQASKVLYDNKYDGVHAEEDFKEEQRQRMMLFATEDLKTVNEWGKSIPINVSKWDSNKLYIMRGIMLQALVQNDYIKSALMQMQGDILEDLLPDHFWGYSYGHGQNMIGYLWKDIREHIKRQPN